MILLKELKIKDFISHEKTTISFREDEKSLILGRSGSGKSTITEAILWALYGKGRSDNRSLIRRGAKTAAVSLKLVDGESETLITRTVSSTGKNALLVTRNTGSGGQFLPIEREGLKNIQGWIEGTLLKASYELFTNSIAFPQENENSFVKANASRRKDLLLEIVRAGNFDELYDKARKAISQNEMDSAVSVSKIENLETTIKNSTEEAGKLDLYNKEVKRTSAEIESLILLEKDLERETAGISGLVKQIFDKKSMCTMIEGSITSINKQLEEDQLAIREHAVIDIDSAIKDVRKGDELGEEIVKIEESLKDNASRQMKINAHLADKPSVTDSTREIELMNERLIPLIKDSGKCPSGDKCPFVEPIKSQIAFLSEQVAAKTKKAELEKLDLKGWEEVYASLAPIKNTSDLYTELEDKKTNRDEFYKQKNVVDEYDKFSTRLADIVERKPIKEEEKTKLESDSALLKGQIVEDEKKLAEFDSNKVNAELSSIRVSKLGLQRIKDESAAGMLLAEKAKETVKTSTDELAVLKKDVSKAIEDKKALEALKEALSPRGVKAVVIDYLVPQLEERINEVLCKMSDFRIHLDTQKDKVDSGVKEGLFITVKNDNGEELPLENLSGGEGIKVETAISEALASLMSSIGFRILDESVSSLDNESTQSFMHVIFELQQKFPQLLIISHLTEIQDLFENKIVITKKDGVSKIV